MNNFEEWLNNQFSATANTAPLVSPNPSQARFRQIKRWPLAYHPVLRSFGGGLAFAAAVLFGICAATTHSLNPAVAARQAAASIGACAGDLAHAQFGTCLSEFTTPQFDKNSQKLPQSVPNPNPTTPQPKTSPPAQLINSPPAGANGNLFIDDFQSNRVGSRPSFDTGSSDHVQQEGQNKYLNVAEARMLISQSGWTVGSITGAIREHGGIAAVGVTDGTTSYFCGVSSGQLELSVQDNSGARTLARTAYGVDVSTLWVGLELGVANGQATCITHDGQAKIQAGIKSGFRANGAILQSRITNSPLNQSNDFDNVAIGG